MSERVVVAIKERSAGNERVGDMWLDTKVFSLETPVIEILAWAGTNLFSAGYENGGKYGRLMLTVADEATKENAIAALAKAKEIE